MAWKLSPATVVRLRKRYALGRASMSTLARQYGVGESQMGRILRGESRRQVSGPITARQLLHTTKGAANGRSKLTARQVRQMRARYRRGGSTQSALGRAYGITAVGAHLILRRKSWAHLSP